MGIECSVTRRDYRDNPDVLFAPLSKALPNAKWAGVKWMRGRVERVCPLVWPVPVSVEPDQAMVEMREIVRVMLFLDEQDLPRAGASGQMRAQFLAVPNLSYNKMNQNTNVFEAFIDSETV